MLRLDHLVKHFGGVYAVNDVTLDVKAGEFRAIIGPNGAGKSTLFNLITGFLVPDQGTITFRDRRVDQLPPYERAKLGIAIVFQSARIFRGMTVLENIMVGAHPWTHSGFVDAIVRSPRGRREESTILEAAHEAVARVGLAGWEDRAVESVPFGIQRIVQVGRALASQPKILLLDEPASGLRPAEREALAQLLEQLKQSGLTILLIEHDVAFVSRLADVVTVMQLGAVIAEGSPDTVRKDPQVIAAYLGADDDGAA
ncbi:MAG: ABC transporter ATP-binding protein [Firmicutes bacterium]|nr:ABC transporter ATP-binding protein [Alicyclobacillaceae bacterium]MCL6496229.1 ABC transporter ATP-binding protein [Bacillota bacterium]